MPRTKRPPGTPSSHQRSHRTKRWSLQRTNCCLQIRLVFGLRITRTASSPPSPSPLSSGKLMSCRRKFRASPGLKRQAKQSHHPRAATNHWRLAKPSEATQRPKPVTTAHSTRYLVIGTLVCEGTEARHPLTADQVFLNNGVERCRACWSERMPKVT